jgi:cytochrome c2
MQRLTRLFALALALPLVACSNSSATTVVGGDAKHGARLIRSIGCGSCHSIPGIADARGKVGPPLDDMSERTIIAGMLANTQENMMAWIKTPQAIVPGNAMPNLGLTDDQARDITAYLYTLH